MIPYIRGKVTRQAHVDIPEGTYEEEYAREGFFGRYAHLYRTAPPVGWTEIEGDLKPRAFDPLKIEKTQGGDYLGQREVMLLNHDVEIAYVSLNVDMPYFMRNADGDEVFFIHQGKGILETDFGPLQYQVGDYLVVPRGTVFRFKVFEKTDILNILSFSEIRLPDKGILGQHALLDPAMIQVPTPELNQDHPAGNYDLLIRRCGGITKVVYPFYPINTVGWKGTLTVWQINVKDIRPVSSDRYHLPPSAHITFVANQFVICTFLPRPLENGDPNALKVPFYHSNIDYDEVLFYHHGQFFSRAGMKEGMITFHPQGIHHGPQADAIKRTNDIKYTNEIAVMIDTRNPLQVSGATEDYEWKEYWKSWRTT